MGSESPSLVRNNTENVEGRRYGNEHKVGFRLRLHNFVKSQKSAERMMKTISQFIEKKLKLKVNQDKSKVVSYNKVKYLAFTVVNGTIAIAHSALQPALDKFNQCYLSWSNY